MELHQLRYLISVVEEGSFTAAAEREHVSQSGVSAQVAKLERELGQALLDRGPRSIRLTVAGEAVLPLARAVLAGVGEIIEVADQVSGVVRGRVRLGMIRGCSIPPFLDAVAGFGREHPGVELVLSEDDSDDLQIQVAAGGLDLALVGYADRVHEGLAVHVVVDEPCAVMVPADHALAGRPGVRLRDLAGETLLALSTGTGVRAAFDRSCAAAGVDLRVALSASSPETVLGLARRGGGVAVLSGSMASKDDGLVVRDIEDATTHACLGLVSRSGRRSTASRELMARLVCAFG